MTRNIVECKMQKRGMEMKQHHKKIPFWEYIASGNAAWNNRHHPHWMVVSATATTPKLLVLY